MATILSGFSSILSFQVLSSLGIGVLLGLFVGALPGLTAIMALVLLIPITFWLPSSAGLAMLLGVYNSAIWAGGISAILINTPGTPASIASTFDGYKLVKKGFVALAVWINTFYSVLGGIFGSFMLVIAAFPIARFALRFGPAEYFALVTFGLSMMISVSGKSVIKGLTAGFLGFAITTIGLDPTYAVPRFSFGSIYLLSGISFLPIMIGLFGIGEVLDQVITPLVMDKGAEINGKKQKSFLNLKEIWETKIAVLYACIISVFIGAIPGVGADIAAIVSWDNCKKFSKKGEEYGKGSVEALAVTCASNNACLGGSMTTMLSLGIPGSAATAILIGALMMYGYIPGPLLFRDHMDMVSTVVALMFTANLFIAIIGFFGTKVFSLLLKLPRQWINLTVVCFSLVGSYALNNAALDVMVCLIAGIVGFIFRRTGFPLGPVVIALILGPLAEENAVRALILSRGDAMVFLTRPISLVLLIGSLLSLFVLPILTKIYKSKKNIIK